MRETPTFSRGSWTTFGSTREPCRRRRSKRWPSSLLKNRQIRHGQGQDHGVDGGAVGGPDVSGPGAAGVLRTDQALPHALEVALPFLAADLHHRLGTVEIGIEVVAALV